MIVKQIDTSHNAAHDLNNILSVIDGYARMARRAAASGRGDVMMPLERISEAVKRGSSLMRRMMHAPRADEKPEDIGLMIRECEPMLRGLLNETHILHIRAAPGAFVLCTGDALLHILMNLVSNARDAMPRGGRIDISLSRRDHHVELSVTDDGEGMDEQVRVKIFEPFFTTKSSGAGTGLGLATVRATLGQMGGEISVSSAPGAGTRFDIRLPAVSMNAENAPDPLSRMAGVSS